VGSFLWTSQSCGLLSGLDFEAKLVHADMKVMWALSYGRVNNVSSFLEYGFEENLVHAVKKDMWALSCGRVQHVGSFLD
jgi:hypothetical protein